MGNMWGIYAWGQKISGFSLVFLRMGATFLWGFGTYIIWTAAVAEKCITRFSIIPEQIQGGAKQCV